MSRSSTFGSGRRGGGGTTQKYFPMNESLLLLIYPVKTVSSLRHAANAIAIMNYSRKFLASNICHNEFVIYFIKSAIVNILGQMPY